MKENSKGTINTMKGIMKKLVTTCFILGMMWIFAPVAEVEASIGELDWQWPVPTSNTMSSCYLDGRSHYAIDITGDKGDEIYATYPGTVIAAGSSCSHNYRKSSSCGCERGLGNYVYIKHEYKGENFVSRYGHLTSVYVSRGDEVTMDTIIGTMGCTGYSSGDHLDFRVYRGSTKQHVASQVAIDPFVELLIPLPEGFHANAGTGCCYSYVSKLNRMYTERASEIELMIAVNQLEGECDTTLCQSTEYCFERDYNELQKSKFYLTSGLELKVAH